MIKGAIQARRDKFVKEMIAYGSESVATMIRAYKASFAQCKSDETARTSGYRLIQDPHIKDAITKGLQLKEEALQKAKKKEIERQAREQVVSETQIDAKLSAIVLGTHKRKKIVVKYDPSDKKFMKTTLEEDPDETAMVAAANLLYKRKGSYAEKKIKHEMGDSFIEALKLISQRKNKIDVQPGSH